MRSVSSATEVGPGATFTFPGQGSYSYTALRELYSFYPQTAPYFERANDISRELLNGDFLALATAASVKEHDERLNACPDLDQIGIYLTEVLVAKILIEHGVKPALLVGHSFGDLAALATAGVYSIEAGLRIVCQRVLALQAHATPGAMAAASCDLEHAKQCIAELGNDSIEISVINHPRQTVVSGKLSALDELGAILNRRGVSLTLLRSKYPYHSSFLEGAVTPFRHALETFDFRPAKIPVYFCMEGMLYSPGSDLAQILSSQFVRTLHFASGIKTLYDSGYRTFIECGAGNIVTKLLGQNLAEKSSDIEALAITPVEGSLRQGLLKLFDSDLGRPEATLSEAEIVRAERLKDSAQLLESISLMVQDLSRLVRSTSCLLEQVSGSLTRAAPMDSTATDVVAQASQPSAVSIQERPSLVRHRSSAPEQGLLQGLVRARGSVFYRVGILSSKEYLPAKIVLKHRSQLCHWVVFCQALMIPSNIGRIS